jgi:predicted RNA-binding protein with PIN domain
MDRSRFTACLRRGPRRGSVELVYSYGVAYVVDGNNVIGQTPGWHRDKPGSRRRLLGELAAFAAASRARVTVVFDGAPDDHVPDGASFKGVKVYYPGRGSDADAVIERLVAVDRNRRGIVVVTSDRRLAAECRGMGAQVLASGEFRKRMAATAAGASTARDPGEAEAPSAGSVDEWMRYFGLDGERE